MNGLTFSEIVKDEICHLDFDDTSSKYLLISFFINNSEFIINNEKYYIVVTHHLANIRLLKSLLNKLDSNLKTNTIQSNLKTASNKTKWALKINNIDEIDKLLNNFQYKLEKMNDEEKRCFFIGAFLSGGSVSFSQNKSNYHFEIRSRNNNYLETLKKILFEFNINSNILKYRNQYKLYFKKSEAISDALKLLGAIDSLYKYEDFRIQRDFSNSLQRINNLDVSNINKTIIAASKQIKWIQTIKNKNMFDNLDDRSKAFADVRMANREASLETISRILKEKYNFNISRTSLNHIVRKIKEIYLRVSTNND